MKVMVYDKIHGGLYTGLTTELLGTVHRELGLDEADMDKLLEKADRFETMEFCIIRDDRPE
jgi:hypothetical protein